jgi:hypothetical protein
VILRRSIPRESPAPMSLDGFANLLGAVTQWRQMRVIHAATVLVVGANLMRNGRN